MAGDFSMGAMADSYYEYLLKTWLIEGKKNKVHLLDINEGKYLLVLFCCCTPLGNIPPVMATAEIWANSETSRMLHIRVREFELKCIDSSLLD